jgi:hypothetical protein
MVGSAALCPADAPAVAEIGDDPKRTRLRRSHVGIRQRRRRTAAVFMLSSMEWKKYHILPRTINSGIALNDLCGSFWVPCAGIEEKMGR